jgi:hypothetical protein
VEKKLPKGLSSAVDAALSGEALVAGAVLENDSVQQSPTAVLLTAQHLLLIGVESSRRWPLDEVAVTDYQEGVPGCSAALAVPRDHPHFDLRLVHEELAALDNPAMTAKVAELAWWDGRAAWPYGALGRVAGGSTELVPGERGTLRLVQNGVYLHHAERPEPSLQLPWVEVTSIMVENPEELSERLGAARVAELGVLAWGLSTTGGECFVTVTTKHDELYYAAQAPPEQLRQHWTSVLAQFKVDADEVVAAPPSESDLVGKLERLAVLHARGALTQEEFAAAKAAVIAGR